MFKTNYQRPLLEDGTYEVQIMEAEFGKADTGSEYIELTIKVREDVEQEGGGHTLYERMWKNNSTGEYNQKRLNNLCKSAGIPEGTEFADEQDFCQYITGKIVKINLVKKFDDYRNEDINSIVFYQSTDAPLKTADAPKPKATAKPEPKKELPPFAKDIEEDNDDDLPW